MASTFSITDSRTTLEANIKAFFKDNPGFRLHDEGPYIDERFGTHKRPHYQQAPIKSVEHTTVHGPRGSIPVRILHPHTAAQATQAETAGALVYFHGAGYTAGGVDGLENGLRIVAEEAGIQVYAVKYSPAPEGQNPVQLGECVAVIQWLQGEEGKKRGVHPDKILAGGDSVGGNMAAAVTLRLRNEEKQNVAGQLLLYPEEKVPFGTLEGVENKGGYYRECHRMFSFGDDYWKRGMPPSLLYVPPGTQPVSVLSKLPPAAVFSCGLDPLHEVGVDYASKLRKAGNQVAMHDYEKLAHGFMQKTSWDEAAREAAKTVGREAKRLLEISLSRGTKRKRDGDV